MPDFFAQPVLNSPYEYPCRHWDLDEDNQPTQTIVESRRSVSFITPIPRSRRHSRSDQSELNLDEGAGISDEDQQYDLTSIINEVRGRVDAWRTLAKSQWNVTQDTANLLNYWRNHQFSSMRPFFCQLEAVETAIWLSEVAPSLPTGKRLLAHLKSANEDSNPGLNRLALKLATGAGKTTVMAMLIAWQTINAVRRPDSKKFTNGFLLIAPGLTIRDRLRVLQPNDPENYYTTRELLPTDYFDDIKKARVVISNYHAFQLREKISISPVNKKLLQGQIGPEIKTTETEGQMLQRAVPELLGMKNVVVINDEAHHCYREKPEPIEGTLTGDDKKEAEKNTEAARLWISGIEALQRKIGVRNVFDLSATPFFLRGSGYKEGTLFPWTMSDFSLMDAIECGIVKLPRVPIDSNENVRDDMPKFRNLWEHIRSDMPKKRRATDADLDPQSLPPLLLNAIDSLYGHYKKTFHLWQKSNIGVPPCFIVVCQNTSISKLIYDYLSGYYQKNDDGTDALIPGKCELFRNFDDYNQPLPRPRTLLIDSMQLESGEGLDRDFRAMAGPEIERFRREIAERNGQAQSADKIPDQDLLREVMNTVGKPKALGSSIRCVVSVSMLTEGWDANNVTHILGVRAFGTQLLCEQVVGRALRRQSYELEEIDGEKIFPAEYADIYGIPFDFTAKPTVSPPTPPKDVVTVKAINPDRAHLEITFPRVNGYRVEHPNEKLRAKFTDDSTLRLTPDLIGPTTTEQSGIIGKREILTVEHLKEVRSSELIYSLTERLLATKLRNEGEAPPLQLFFQVKPIVRDWLENHLECKGGTQPAQLLYRYFADMACQRINAAITRAHIETTAIRAILNPYNPTGSTRHVRFTTSKTPRWDTASERPKNHINYVIADSDWEIALCRVIEAHPRVTAYTKNHNLGLTAPYMLGSDNKTYIPDFILLVDDGQGPDNPLHLIIEVKGYRGEDAKDKKETMETRWIPGVNRLGTHGRWAFAEFTDVWEMESDLENKIAEQLDDVLPELDSKVSVSDQ
ncbi:MAG: DEAD/DEAH box helicase family protein [Verrucomicrobiota bacterium]